MMLAFLLLCLFISMFVLQSYVSTGFHAREHRLLPLLLGLICLYNFYRVIQEITGHVELIQILANLLIVQMVYLLLHYIMDFMHYKLSLWLEIILFCSLVLVDVMIMAYVKKGEEYQDIFVTALVAYALLIIFFATYVRFHSRISLTEKHVNNMISISIAFPGVALFCRAFSDKTEAFVLPVALEATCLIVYYLMKTGQLSNVTVKMQENFYNTCDIATILFDGKCDYRDANLKARELYPDVVEALEKNPNNYFFQDKIQAWSRNLEKDYEFQREDACYKCRLEMVSHRGRLQGYMLSMLDITHEKQEIELMEQLKQEAEKQSGLKSKLLAGISHDLRSPLHAIIGGADVLLRQKYLSAESETVIDYIRSAGNQLLHQVDMILAGSKLEAGMLVLHKQEYNFYHLLQEQARSVFLNLQEKDIDFSIRAEDPFPEKMVGDETQVRQIVQNLLSNAVKYTESGKITFSIWCKIEGERILLTGCVADTGIGMTQQTAERIFQEYVSFSEEVGAEGTGLGLSIVKQLVEMMEGQVSAKSMPGKGTEITFTLQQNYVSSPMMSPLTIDRHILEESPATDERGENTKWIYPNVRILLADDMESNRVIFRKLLEPWELTVDLAESGREAVELARKQNYQLILLDQMMPGMSGFDTAEQIRRFCDTPLVLVTADITEATREKSIRTGFAHCIPKPIQTEKLGEILDSCLPRKYRRLSKESVESVVLRKDKKEMLTHARILETYCREIQKLLGVLEEYKKSDPALFQTKVHGIKGISRQIGREDAAIEAEIMEMAVQTQNFAFLDRHFGRFLGRLQKIHDEVEQEYKNILQRFSPDTEAAADGKDDHTDSSLYWRALKEGFDTYDLECIEKNLASLSRLSLSPEEENRLSVVTKAWENLDYEIGSANCGF